MGKLNDLFGKGNKKGGCEDKACDKTPKSKLDLFKSKPKVRKNEQRTT